MEKGETQYQITLKSTATKQERERRCAQVFDLLFSLREKNRTEKAELEK